MEPKKHEIVKSEYVINFHNRKLVIRSNYNGNELVAFKTYNGRKGAPLILRSPWPQDDNFKEDLIIIERETQRNDLEKMINGALKNLKHFMYSLEDFLNDVHKHNFDETGWIRGDDDDEVILKLAPNEESKN